MVERRFGFTFKLWNDALRQRLTQFNSPLIERVDVPDRSLCKHRVLVECDEFAQRFRRKPLRKNCIRRAIAFENAMRHQPIRCSLGLNLLRSFSESQRLSLRSEEHTSQLQS